MRLRAASNDHGTRTRRPVLVAAPSQEGRSQGDPEHGTPRRAGTCDDWRRPVGRGADVFLMEVHQQQTGRPTGRPVPAAFRRWELAKLPPPLLRYVLAVEVVYVAIGILGALQLTVRPADLATCLTFIALASIALLVAHRLGVPGGRQDDRARHGLLAQWTAPVALLLPPAYAVAVSLPLCCVARGRGVAERPQTWFACVFDAATLGIAGFLASSVHLMLVPTKDPYQLGSLAGSTGRIGALFAATAVYLAISHLLLAGVRRVGGPRRARRPQAESPGRTRPRAARHPPAILTLPGIAGLAELAGLAGSRNHEWRPHPPALPHSRPGSPENPTGVMIWGEALLADAIGMCSAIVVTASWAAHPLLVVAAAPPALLLQRSLLHPQLLHAARNDAKTGLANPAWWREVAEAEVARTRRAKRPLSVLILDIDHFKWVNDNYGHIAGDLVLAAVASTLRAATRPHQLVGRFGGEEFVVLLAELDIDGAAHVAERLRRQVAATRCRLDGHPPLSVTVSVGVAAAAGPDINLTFLLEQADAALYRAKADGRNRIRLAGPS
jgi:diguanylate cyclase (GGDEF)-like protein